MDFKILLKVLPFTLLLLAGRFLKEASAPTTIASKPAEILAHNTVQPVSQLIVATGKDQLVAATGKEIKPLPGKRL